MSGKFNMDDYIDVAERHRLFLERFPEGRLQSEIVELTDTRCVVKAYAFRDANDTHPGVGHSMLTIPGSTPYTRGSELENAETSAWGRAIVACGFETKKIASRNEVRNKSDAEPTAMGSPAGGERSAGGRESASGITETQLATIAELVPALAQLRGTTVEAVNAALTSDNGSLTGLSQAAASELVGKLQRWKTNLEASAGAPQTGTDGGSGEPQTESGPDAPADTSPFQIPEKARKRKAA